MFDGLRAEDADTRYRESHLYAVDVATRDIRQITTSKGPWMTPVVSPDGKPIAFVGFEWTPQTYKTDELYVIDIDGTNARQISGDFDRDPEQLHWAADGTRRVLHRRGSRQRNVYVASVQGGVRPVTTGAQMLSPDLDRTERARGGTCARRRSSPGDVVAFKLERKAGSAAADARATTTFWPT